MGGEKTKTAMILNAYERFEFLYTKFQEKVRLFQYLCLTLPDSMQTVVLVEFF